MSQEYGSAREEVPRLAAALGADEVASAEALVPAGARTLLHRHHETEDLYHITAGPLHILCCCSPAYRHGDTEMLEGQASFPAL